ncbi:DUF2931 family protein [Flavobacterium hercynium]|uniref:DUF2931 domain-containing protein n=1 Tax=Flavobacterium hercynium TaxID=387094 RepID=A0A226GXW0_9FLAO|nr:DUF2931 family protein [Flavobacterium hercynium]OXA86889.1 hypothetical protein B0A66_17115 [Flavobacterium hercynium]
MSEIFLLLRIEKWDYKKMANNMKITTILFMALSLFSCQNNKKQKKYSWTASVCTPRNYPAEIFSGHLIVGKTLQSGYVYMPFDLVINSNNLGDNDGSPTEWATEIAPKFLDITWLSFTEKKSYSGVFELDSEKIESLMINGSDRPYWDPETKKKGIANDRNFAINTGLFPGGMVVLYVFSQSNMTIVGRYQAHEDKNVEWGIAHEIMKTKAGFDRVIDANIKELPQEILDQIANGTIPFGYWETLFREYHIMPLIKAEDKVETIRLKYINGEAESIFLSLNGNSMPIKKRAIPRKINIVWHDVNDVRMETDIFFDEKKSKAIFERIGTAEPIGFVIDIDRNTKPRETQGLSIKLKISSGVIDMNEAIESQESFTKPKPY